MIVTKFAPGTIVQTPGTVNMAINLLPYLFRHLAGDWGEVSADDKALNDDALVQGTRLMSKYTTPAGDLWIITEADRSATTLLLPDEY